MRAAAIALAGALLGAPALAQGQAPAGAAPNPGVTYPQVSFEGEFYLFFEGRPRAAEGRTQGGNLYFRGEAVTGFHLSPQLSVQMSLHAEPVQEVQPNGGFAGFRYPGAFMDALYIDWRPSDRLRFEIGKFTAPFGYGYEQFPGIMARWRAHEVYWIRESLGLSATWTALSDPRFGEHDISAAVFTLDRSILSTTLGTSRRCCAVEAERYSRNTAEVGGAGNTGRLNNFAVALDGDRFGWLPNFAYHAAVLSRGPGQDGTAREWGYALGARYEHRWTPALRTQFFFEHVEFRNAGGRPIVQDEEGNGLVQAARRRFTTLGARTTWQGWRGAVTWQRDQQKRSVDPLPTQWFLEFSVGRDLGGGFGVDVGYQYSRVARDSGAPLLDSHAVLTMLTWRPRFNR